MAAKGLAPSLLHLPVGVSQGWGWLSAGFQMGFVEGTPGAGVPGRPDNPARSWLVSAASVSLSCISISGLLFGLCRLRP